MTAHVEQIGNGTAPASTYFPWACIVRFDDVPLSGSGTLWDASPSGNNSLNQMRIRHNYYRNDPGNPFFVCQDIDTTWGDRTPFSPNPNFHMVDHARDLLSLGTVDLLLMPNEPDDTTKIYVSPQTYAGWVYDIKRYAAPMVPNVLIGGPQLSTWSLDPTDPVRVWFDEFDRAGGLDMLDVVCIHPYCHVTTVNPAIQIPVWINDPYNGILSKIRGKPLMFTEMATQPVTCDTRKGDHTPAHMAACDFDYVTGCAGYPMILYDGAYSLNGGGYSLNPMGVTVTTGATSQTQLVSDATGMLRGMQLSFFIPANRVIPYVVATVDSVPNPTTVKLTAVITTHNGDFVTDQSYSMGLSYWASNTWQPGGPGKTPLGVALAGLMPPRIP